MGKEILQFSLAKESEKRSRLAALIDIGRLGKTGKGDDRVELLNEVLSKDPGPEARGALLESFFNRFIPGGWTGDPEAKDERFLLYAPTTNPFWYDW
ncbi:MAG: hypothetical protein ACFFE8_08420 [Candidatus Heimdallarchaeota archaeon]